MRHRAIVVLAVALLAAAPLQGGRLAVTPTSNGRVEYDFSSTTDTTQGPEHEQARIALSGLRRGELRVEIASSDGTAANGDATYGKDGTVVPDAPTDFLPQDNESQPGPTPPPALHVALQRVNEMVQLVHAAPNDPQPGDAWPADVTVPLPRSDTMTVHARVHVAKADGDALDLIAEGTGKTTLAPPPSGLSYQNQGALGDGPDAFQGAIPLTVELKGTAHFEHGALVSATGSLHSSLTLGNEKRDVTTEWTLDRE